jgi:peroxiredoxin Q/BCP
MTTLKRIKLPFSALDQDGKLHQLADYAGKKLVVFFYPKRYAGMYCRSV